MVRTHEWQAPRQDRRSKRTRRMLGEALVALMLEKRYDTITVQEIIDRANVDRSTFYAHYIDLESNTPGSRQVAVRKVSALLVPIRSGECKLRNPSYAILLHSGTIIPLSGHMWAGILGLTGEAPHDYFGRRPVTLSSFKNVTDYDAATASAALPLGRRDEKIVPRRLLLSHTAKAL